MNMNLLIGSDEAQNLRGCKKRQHVTQSLSVPLKIYMYVTDNYEQRTYISLETAVINGHGLQLSLNCLRSETRRTPTPCQSTQLLMESFQRLPYAAQTDRLLPNEYGSGV